MDASETKEVVTAIRNNESTARVLYLLGNKQVTDEIFFVATSWGSNELVNILANRVNLGSATTSMVYDSCAHDLHDVASQLVALLPPEACTYEVAYQLFVRSAEDAALTVLQKCTGEPTDDECGMLLAATVPGSQARKAVLQKFKCESKPRLDALRQKYAGQFS